MKLSLNLRIACATTATVLLAGCFLSHDNTPPAPRVDAGPPAPRVDERECNPEVEPPGDRGCEGGPFHTSFPTPTGPLAGWYYVGREDVDGVPVRACVCAWHCRRDADCPARDGVRSRCVSQNPPAHERLFTCLYPCDATSDCPSGMRCLVTSIVDIPRACAWAVDDD